MIVPAAPTLATFAGWPFMVGFPAVVVFSVASFVLPSPYDITTFLTAVGSGLGLGYLAFMRLKMKALREWDESTKESSFAKLRLQDALIAENRRHIADLKRQIEAILVDHQMQISTYKVEIEVLRTDLDRSRNESLQLRNDLTQFARVILEQRGYLESDRPSGGRD